MRRSRVAAALVCVVVLLAGSGDVPAFATPGSAGAGDPYFPRQGNGGYDVQHYTIRLAYRPRTRHIAGTVQLQATAHQRLTRFDLDLRLFMHVSRVLVNGRSARFGQPSSGHELVIVPPVALPAGRRFAVFVRYAGTGRAIRDPGGALDGWIPTRDGAFVANEPQGSPSWFPVNDTPRDKATYTVAVTVPSGWVAVSNGRMSAPVRSGGWTTWTWRMTDPIPSYLVTATVGRFDLHRGHTPRGVPFVVAVDPTQRSGTAMVLRKLPQMVDFFSSRFGAYPFPQTGAIVDDAPNVGYALETATRPLFPQAPDELTLAHELAHQWFGDTVTLRRWRDIWINEGFAQWAQWLWQQHRGGLSLRRHLAEFMTAPADHPIWNPPPGNPGSAAQIFADSVYFRGAATLEALREKIGDRVFYRILRGWVAAHRYGNATSRGFAEYAGRVAHRDLRVFFYRWLFRPGKP